MKKKTRYILSIMLSLLMCFSAIPVFAASIGSDTNDVSVGVDTDQNVRTTYSVDADKTDVYMTVDSGDVVAGVPTNIILSGVAKNGEHTGDYQIYVEGDIAGDWLVTVEPDKYDVVLNQVGKTDVDAKITQDKISFTADEISEGITTNGKIMAENLSAGSWESNFNWVISSKENPYYTTAKIDYFTWGADTEFVDAYNTGDISRWKGLVEEESVDGCSYAYPSATGITGLTDKGIRWLKDNGGNLILPNCATEISNGTNAKTGSFSYDKYGCILKTVIVPGNILDIGDYAFYKQMDICDLHIENGCNRIGIGSFLCMDILSAPLTLDDVTSGSLKTLSLPDSIKVVDSYAFGYQGLKSIDLNDGLISIKNHSFMGCQLNTNLIIPNSVVDIGNSAFSSNYLLSGVVFGHNVKTIGQSAFNGCYNVESCIFTNPENVSLIDKGAFMLSSVAYDWSLLKNATFGDNYVANPNANVNDYNWTSCQNACVGFAQHSGWLGPQIIKVSTNNLKFSTNGCGHCALTSAYNGLFGTNYTPATFFDKVFAETDFRMSKGFVNPTDYVTLGDKMGFNAIGHKVADGFQPLYDTLANGGYAIITVANTAANYSGHAFLCYGVADNGDILIANSGTWVDGDENLYGQIPITNLSDSRNYYTCVTK